MATYYVTTTGNNANPGTSESPWLTLEYALTQMGTGGHTISVGAGTYQMTNGVNDYYPFAWSFTNPVVVTSTTQTASDVIISGPTPGAGATDFKLNYGDVANLTFSKVKFVNRTGNTVFIGTFSTGNSITNLHFDDCIFDMSATINYLFVVAGYIGAMSGVQFNRCTMTIPKEGTSGVTITGGGGTITSCSASGCTISSAGAALNWRGVSNCTISNNAFTLSASGGTKTAIVFGVAGAATEAYPGSGNVFSNNTVHMSGPANGYAHICGSGVRHVVTFSNNRFTGSFGDIFLKGSTGSKAIDNTFIGCGQIELKSAVSAIVTGNVASGTTQVLFSVPISDVGTMTSGCTITNNRFQPTATGGKCYSIVSNHWGSGNVVDFNTLLVSGGAKFGDVLGTTGITSLANLRASWSSYDLPANDANSRDSAAASIPILAALMRYG